MAGNAGYPALLENFCWRSLRFESEGVAYQGFELYISHFLNTDSNEAKPKIIRTGAIPNVKKPPVY